MRLVPRTLICVVLAGGFPAHATAQDDSAAAEAAAETPAIPELAADDLPAWRDYLRPCASELAWQEIPWLPTFTEGVLRADAEEKPLLFWAMNGHPLGCT